MLMNALKYDVYTDNDFNVSKLSNRIQILKSRTKRSWGSLNVNGGYWNILRISLNQVDNETI